MNATEASTAAALLPLFKAWSSQGWLRRLDHAFARFLLELAPDSPPCVVLAAALLAHVEGQGHTCLPIDALLREPEAWLDWPSEGAAPLRELLDRVSARPGDWLAALRASRLVEVVDPGAAATRSTRSEPLVLRGTQLYLRRYWRHECEVALQVRARQQVFDGQDRIDVEAARVWLDRLFPAAPGATSTPVDWQKIACALALRRPLTVVTGGPGTGKTYTAARLLALLLAIDPRREHLRIALAAPTGKAAARLKQSIDGALDTLQAQLGNTLALRALTGRIGAARTLHALLGARPDTRAFRHDAAHPLDIDVLFVDEASMVHLEMMAALLAAVPPRARVILLGDKDQLASVEAGAVLGELCRDADEGRYDGATVDFVAAVAGQEIPAAMRADGPALAQQTVMLRESRRFGGPIGRLALAVNAGDALAAAALLQEGAGGALHRTESPNASAVLPLALNGRSGAAGGYREYLEAIAARPAQADASMHETWARAVLAAFERFRVLCAVREGEWGAQGLNAAIEQALATAGLPTRRGEWYEGRPVMVTRNDRSLGVFNGDIGIALKALDPGAPLRAWFPDGDGVRSVGVSRLADVDTAYAMTVHKSQGSEFDHTVLVLPAAASRVLTRELVYTGITRARSAFTLVSGRPAALAEALARRTQRSSGLQELLS